MTLDEVIRYIKQALEKMNPDKRACYEFRFTVEQVKQLLEWMDDYKQLKEDDTCASGWIPCSERMPEDDEEVLFAVTYPWDKGKKPNVKLGRHHGKNEKRWWTVYYGAFLDYEVTHWMPLPEPPEAEDKA